MIEHKKNFPHYLSTIFPFQIFAFPVPPGAQGQFEKIPFHYKKRGNMTQQSTSRLFFTFLQAQKYHHLRSCLSCGKL